MIESLKLQTLDEITNIWKEIAKRTVEQDKNRLYYLCIGASTSLDSLTIEASFVACEMA
jgi:hypothetical protein